MMIEQVERLDLTRGNDKVVAAVVYPDCIIVVTERGEIFRITGADTND